MADNENRIYKLLSVRGKVGNIGSLKTPGTPLTSPVGGLDLGLMDHAHRMAPAVLGGLTARAIYQWGIRTFKVNPSEQHFWQIAKNDESAGAFAIWLFTYLVLRILPGATTERFVCGLMGRGSIVLWNTLMRWFGKVDWIRTNQPDTETFTQIEIVPAKPNQAPANQTVATPPALSEAELDEELLKEVGRLAQRSPEFQSKVSGGFARRVNEYLDNQGRKPIEEEEVHRQVVDLFDAMARR